MRNCWWDYLELDIMQDWIDDEIIGLHREVLRGVTMTKALSDAIRAVIQDASKATVDNHGYVHYMDRNHLAVLVVEFDKYCKKHHLMRERLTTAHSAPSPHDAPRSD